MSSRGQNKASKEEQHRRKKQRTSQALQEFQAVDASPKVDSPAKVQKAQAPLRVGARSTIDRSEYVRLLQQTLANLGFHEVADHLQRESGVRLETEQAELLQGAVLGGDWTAALHCVSQLGLPEGQRKEVEFLILEQKFSEALEAGDSAEAVRCLRQEVTGARLPAGDNRLHALAFRLLGPPGSGASDGEEGAKGAAAPGSKGETAKGGPPGKKAGTKAAAAKASAAGRGKGAAPEPGPATLESRRALLERLRGALPAGTLLPPARLLELVEGLLQAQVDRCPLHNTPDPSLSLLSDYACGREQVPGATCQVLADHSDEVWHLAFSPDGAMLATGSKDGTAIIWDVARPGEAAPGGGAAGEGRVRRRHVLSGHVRPVSFVAWSPDSSMLATCGQDMQVRVWDAASGLLKRVLSHHKGAVTCAAWLPSGDALVTGSHDRRLCVVGLSSGGVQRTWLTPRLQDLVVAGPEGRFILATSSDSRIRVFDAAAYGEGYLDEEDSIISMSLAGDQLLVNTVRQSMHLWDLGGLDLGRFAGTHPAMAAVHPTAPVARFHRPQRRPHQFVVRACLGGLGDKFILSGSEEGRVYVFARRGSELVAELEGHAGTVNAVAWNPRDPHLFASASDDRTVRVWGIDPAVERRLRGGAAASPSA